MKDFRTAGYVALYVALYGVRNRREEASGGLLALYLDLDIWLAGSCPY